ncbi:MAG: hypothetical protein WBC18_20505 [Ottowia sp.]|uniref:hypothetical protein n=1 Tax=Ottowia sp. TaxID=1898956 RepID=UPI003C73DB81
MSNLHPIFEDLMECCKPFPARRSLPSQPSANISHGGIDWQVTYDYERAQRETRIDPPYPASVKICEVYLLNDPERNDFYSVLAESFIKELEAKVLESLEES